MDDMKNKNKNTPLLEVQNNYISEEGELVESVDIKRFSLGEEPAFVKMYTKYLQDLGKIFNLTVIQQNIMQVLSINMDYNNQVLVNKLSLPTMAAQARVSQRTFKEVLPRLMENGLLYKMNPGVYIINPEYASKGRWQDTRSLQIKINYTLKGRQIEVMKITDKTITVKEVLLPLSKRQNDDKFRK